MTTITSWTQSVCVALHECNSLSPAIKTLTVYLGDETHTLKFKAHYKATIKKKDEPG